jgi:AraC-like DNA-binding protein
MYIFQQYFHAIGSFNCLVLCFVLLFSKGSTYTNKVLALWCFVLSMYMLTPLILLNSEFAELFYLFGWSLWAPASFGAFMYLYVSSSVTERQFSLKDIILFIPLLICLIINIELLTASLVEVRDFMALGASQSGGRILSLVIIYSQALFFFVLSVRLLFSLRSRAVSNLTNFNPRIFNALLLLLGLNFWIWIFELVSNLLGESFLLLFLSDILFILFVSALALFHWKVPAYFHIEHLDVGEDSSDTKSHLADQETRKAILEEILNFMQTKKPFLNSDMSLLSLSNDVGINRNLISETLNKEANKNFYRFVNEYRIEMVCRLLKSRTDDKKIMDIAFESGFSSKSTFNNVFKLIVGVTPSQFMKNE